MTGAVYYNEINPYDVIWLKNLISSGEIPNGDVDDRSIENVRPKDLDGYTSCHFFAGIGGWPLALRIAGWPDDRPVWTGSCPCTRYSNAGKKDGRENEIHLWPTWYGLIAEQAPSVIFGEQVANAITYGWMDEVFHDLENKMYACASAVLRACAVNKDHERRRLFFVAQREKHDDYRASAQIQGPDERQTLERQKMGDAEFCDAATLGKFQVCSDGLKRKTFAGITLFSHGLPDQLDIEQAFGNAIVPKLASEFIAAYMEISS